MNGSDSLKSSFAPPDALRFRRRLVTIAEDALARSYLPQTGGTLPLVVEAALEGVGLSGWAVSRRQSIEAFLARHGALLFRGFRALSLPELEQFIAAVSGELLEYSYRSTPRTLVSGRIYTSTEYPPAESILLHNEMAYTSDWPMRIFFMCLQPAQHGGATPLADSRRVYERINPTVREKFISKGVMYVRNYGGGLDLPWQEVFQTDEKDEVEAYCRRAGISFEWKAGGRLHTRHVCQAVITHPATGEKAWFNQALMFHFLSLRPEVRDALLSMCEPEDLPRNAYYGDGSAIEPSALDEILEAYRREETLFEWREGDVLMVDNVLAAHGRTPFEGARRVVVGMSEPGRVADGRKG